MIGDGAKFGDSWSGDGDDSFNVWKEGEFVIEDDA